MGFEKIELAGGRAVLYRGDMFSAMPDMPEVDALIADPPYCSGGMIHLELNETRLNAVLQALLAADLALSASHNLTATDCADLPRADWPVFVLDHRAELAGLGLIWRLLAEAAANDPAASARIAALNPRVVELPLGG